MLLILTWTDPPDANSHIAYVPPFIDSYMSLSVDIIQLSNKLSFLFYQHMYVGANDLIYKDAFIRTASSDSSRPCTHDLSELSLYIHFDMVNFVASFNFDGVPLPSQPLFYRKLSSSPITSFSSNALFLNFFLFVFLSSSFVAHLFLNTSSTLSFLP